MADIINTQSGYQTGSIDTATTLVNNVSPIDAKHPNGLASAIVQIETILGAGPTLKGAATDLATRLAVSLESNGKLKAFSATTKSVFPVPVNESGTGATSFTDGAVLVGNGTDPIQAIALPNTRKVLSHSGTTGADPEWISGLLFHGPSSCGTGSTRTHEGTVTVSSNGNYSGIHYYTDFILNAGVTMTIPANAGRLVLIASNSITINGTITGAGAGIGLGGTGGVFRGSAGSSGTNQPGGGGGGGTDGGSFYGVGDGVGGSGGPTVVHGLSLNNNGGGGATAGGTATAATQLSGSTARIGDFFNSYGGAGGGGGAGNGSVVGGNGGNGGASIILIAPTIVLASSATLNTSGAAGSNSPGTQRGAGGGGGGGDVFIITRSYTDNSALFILTGGAGGTGLSGGGAGSAGANGIKQILIYA